MKILHKQGNWRIIEQQYTCYDLENLKGDCFNPDCNPDLSKAELETQERDFDQKVDTDGVYGYELQRWNPEVDKGWEHVDSCWGFVGRDEIENHYIVDELKDQIK